MNKWCSNCFKRHFFLRLGCDGQTAFEQLSNNSTPSVDFSEFPGTLINSFMAWIYQQVKPKASNSGLPTRLNTFCMVCGELHPHHNQQTHLEFFKRVDPQFLKMLQQKGRNAIDLIRGLISHLLQHPSGHDSLKQTFERLHCPFCGSGTDRHNSEMHEFWRKAFDIDYPLRPKKEPPTDPQAPDYSNKAYEWVVDQIHPAIPPFLLTISSVRTFMSCLITIWMKVRIHT